MKIIPMSILLIFLTTKVVYAETVELISYKKGTYTGEMVNGCLMGKVIMLMMKSILPALFAMGFTYIITKLKREEHNVRY